MASCAILSNFFEEQRTQNHPQYLSGLSRALFPTTFLEIAVKASPPRLETRLIDVLLPMQPRFQIMLYIIDQPLFQVNIITIESKVNCMHLPNLVNARWL